MLGVFFSGVLVAAGAGFRSVKEMMTRWGQPSSVDGWMDGWGEQGREIRGRGGGEVARDGGV